MAPELSYGTHFFLDLDADGVLYLPILEGKEANIYNREWFSGTPYEEGQHPAVRIYRGNFSVLLDGENDVGVVIVNEP
jgi:serine/threonine-protein kinase RIO1